MEFQLDVGRVPLEQFHDDLVVGPAGRALVVAELDQLQGGVLGPANSAGRGDGDGSVQCHPRGLIFTGHAR